MDHCCRNPAITAERKGSPAPAVVHRNPTQAPHQRKGRADGLGGSPNALRIASGDEAAPFAR